MSGLGGGTYAFTCQGHFERDAPEFESVYGEPSDEIAFAAQFVFDAPPVELTPADETAERRREGYADASDLGGSASEYERMAVFIVERTDGTRETNDGDTAHGARSVTFDQSEVVVTERILRERQLRTAPVAFDGNLRERSRGRRADIVVSPVRRDRTAS